MQEPTRPSGVLRLLVVFHEADALGAGRSVVQTIEPLAKYGWTTAGWFPGDGPLVDEAATLSTAHRPSRDKPIRYSTRGWRADPGVLARLRDTPAYLGEFRRTLLRERPHVVHANTLRTLPEARVARKLGLPVVIHVHELPPPGAKRTVVFRTAAGIADVLVAVSEAVAESLRPHAGRTPIVVAHNGVAGGSIRAHDTPVGPIVGSIGSVCRTKGTDVYLEAAAAALRRRPDLKFEHIGQFGVDEDMDFERRVRALAGADALSEGVTMLGRVPGGERLTNWEIFVLASRQDAFPLASLEAMAAGVPVIATEVGGLPEQIEHLKSGVLVAPGNPGLLADWIIRLHEDGPLRQRLAGAAVERVREQFTIERQAAALHKAYLAALNLRHGPPPVRKRTMELV